MVILLLKKGRQLGSGSETPLPLLTVLIPHAKAAAHKQAGVQPQKPRAAAAAWMGQVGSCCRRGTRHHEFKKAERTVSTNGVSENRINFLPPLAYTGSKWAVCVCVCVCV